MGFWSNFSWRDPASEQQSPGSSIWAGFSNFYDEYERDLQREREERLAELQAQEPPERPSIFSIAGDALAQTGEDIAKATGRGFSNIAGGLFGAGQATAETIARLPVPESWKRNYLESAEMLRRQADLQERSRETGYLAYDTDRPESTMRDIGLGAFEMAPQLATVAATGPTAGVAILGTTSFGNEYRHAKEQGATENEALVSAAVTGATEAVLERFLGDVPVIRAIRGEGGRVVRSTKDALKALLRTGNMEGMEEAAQHLVGRLTQEATYSDEGLSLEDLAEAGKAYGAGFGMAAVPGLAGSRAQMRRSTAAQDQRLPGPQSNSGIPSSERSAGPGVDPYTAISRSEPEMSASRSAETQSLPPGSQVWNQVRPEASSASLTTRRGLGTLTSSSNVFMSRSPGESVQQPTIDVNVLGQLADQAKPQIERYIHELIEAFPGISYAGSRAKTIESMQQKVARRRAEGVADFSAASLGDVLGSRLVAESVDDARNAASRIARDAGLRQEDVDDFFEKTDERAGYRAIHLDVRLANGLLGEIQIVPREIFEVQEQAHKLYETIRDVSPADLDANPEWKTGFQETQRAIRRIFDAAWERHLARGGGQGAPGAYGTILSPAATPEAATGAPAGAQALPEDLQARTRLETLAEQGRLGRADKVLAPGFPEVGIRYAVVELGDLAPSHTDTLQRNPAYPAELQPRERGRKAYDAQIGRIAQNLEPIRLGQNVNASDGAPIVGPDAVVESGNGRVLALRRAYQQNPQSTERYRAWLRDNAESFGVDPSIVESSQAPVLVRVRTSDVDRGAAFAKAANVPTTERMGAVEQATADAQVMPDRILELLQPGEQGEINTAANVPFLREFFGAVTPEGLNAVTTGEGRVSVEGLNRARAAVVARAYDAPGLVEAMYEDPDSNIRRIGNGLLTAAPRYVRMRNRIEAGNLYPLDIAGDLEQALGRLRQIRSQGQTVDEYLDQQTRQGAMFDVREELTPEAAELLQAFGTGDISRSARKINLVMQRYVDLVEGAGNPGQETMFEGMAESPLKLDLIRRAIREYELGGIQTDLFETPVGGAMEIAGRGFVGRLQGPMSWLFGNRRAPLKAPRADDVRSSIDAVEERWRDADGIKTVGMLDRIKDSVKNAVRKAPRTWLDLDPGKSPQHARTADSLRRVTAAESAAASRAFDEIDYITRDLSPFEGELFTRMLVLPDVLKDVEAGLYEGKELPFGYQDAAAVEGDLARFQAQATPAVREALRRRQEIAESVAHRLVDTKLLPEEILTDSRYYHRQVMAYMDGRGRLHEGRRGIRTTRRGFQRSRVGGSDFNTRYAEAEFEWLADSYELLAKHQELQRLKADLNIKPRLVAEAKEQGGKWQDHVPEGYTVWQPQPGNRFYRALTVTESQLEKWFEELKQSNILTGEERAELEAKEALVLGGPREQWVIPEDIAATLDQAGRTDPKDPVTGFLSRAMRKWKQWILINPLRVLKYNLNNISGDLDISIAADPKILKHLPKAFRMVWAYHIGRNPTPALRKKMNEYESLGVINSGWSLQEVEDLGKDGMLRAFTEKRAKPLSRLVHRGWQNLRAFTTARENLLRIASYERALALQTEGNRPAWASNREQLQAIRDPKERAAKLSRELIGDYGNISQGGRWLRANLLPFYSWMEINAPRYVRLLKNAGTEGQGKARIVGARAGGAVARGTVNTTLLAAKAGMLYGLVQLWNRMVFPDEDEQLRRSHTRREPHLILGRTDDGEIRSIRFEGALGDALEWFDLKDLPADVRDLRAGRKTLADMAAEAVKAPIERGLTSIRPEIGTGFELLAGRSVFPRIFEGGTSFEPSLRPVYDRPGSVASTLSLTPVYEAATGKPGRRGSIRRSFEEESAWEALGKLPQKLLAQSVTYVTDPGEAAYWDSKSLVRDWLQEQGKETPTGFEKSKRGMALYYWKKARQYGDERAEKKYRDRYLELGGTQRGMEQSIRMSGPMGGLSKVNQAAFLRSLSPEERQRLIDATRWYSGVFR